MHVVEHPDMIRVTTEWDVSSTADIEARQKRGERDAY